MKSKGIVVKSKDSHCIVLTKEGTYLKVPASRVKNTRVGAETEFSSADWMSQLRPFLMVASILILVLGFGMYRLTATPAAAAYVSLDINPSIELEIDDHTKVIGTHAINGDAEKLLNGMQLKGKDLYTSIREIVDKAATNGYIKPNQTNYVLSSVTLEKTGSNVVNYDNIVKNLQESVDSKELDVEFVIVSTDIATRNEAKQQGISAGKMIVYKNSVSSGEKLTLKQVKQNSLTNLVNTYKVKVLPNNKKAIVKLLHVPPYSQRFKKEHRLPGGNNSEGGISEGNNSEGNNSLLTTGEDSERVVRDQKHNTGNNHKENKNADSRRVNNKTDNWVKNWASALFATQDKQTGLTETDKASSEPSTPELQAKGKSGQNNDTGKDAKKETKNKKNSSNDKKGSEK